MIEIIGRLAYYIFLLTFFFAVPIGYQFFVGFSDNPVVAFLILYGFLSAGYYFLFVLKYTIRDKNGNLVIIEPNRDGYAPRGDGSIDEVLSRGHLEKDFGGAGDFWGVRKRIIKRALLNTLLLLLVLFPLILYHWDSYKYYYVPTSETAGDAVTSAGHLLRLKIEADSKPDLAVLDSVKKEDIVVVRGMYDQVEKVLETAKIPCTVVGTKDLETIELSPKQVLMVNCPGSVPKGAVAKIKKFLDDGGYVFTTDWAIEGTVHKVSPGYIALVPVLSEDVLPVHKCGTSENELTKFIHTDDGSPAWWCEIGFYLIKILKPEAVSVLIESKKMKKRYRYGAMTVEFAVGKGKVIHTVTHFYQKKTSLADSKFNKIDAYAYVTDHLKIDGKRLETAFADKLKKMKGGEIENTYSIMRFIANVIIARKKSQ